MKCASSLTSHCWNELTLFLVVYVIHKIFTLTKVMGQVEPTPTLTPSNFSEAFLMSILSLKNVSFRFKPRVVKTRFFPPDKSGLRFKWIKLDLYQNHGFIPGDINRGRHDWNHSRWYSCRSSDSCKTHPCCSWWTRVSQQSWCSGNSSAWNGWSPSLRSFARTSH